ncbi:hypothetical protein [Alicyclobacillus fastidiosus]|uniref:Uncharacterized protein n=1 Tax=Alicyclobacillus fastidiosus TaxID=392011 RepID=A0ABV5AL87_9BACL|nr:hypothetical protein [Alicyclobacillus fastidiosus]WEH08173.1 hypothetical protein PYS47_15820 [Alicyclobacillus fastidiosus]
MAQVIFVYDTYGNILTASTAYPQVDPGQQMFIADDVTTPNAAAAKAQIKNYMIQNGAIVPAVTVQIDRTPTANGRWTTYAISLSASDGGAHQVTLSINGQGQTVTTPATVNVDVHQTLLTTDIPVSVTGQGIITNTSFIGGNQPATAPMQMYQPDGQNLKIAPTTKNFLLAYYTAQSSPVTAIADIATDLGLLMDTLFGKVLPALSSGTTPTVALDADETNALTDIQTNLLTKVPTTLKTAAPAPAQGATQTYDLHYASLSRHWSDMESAFNDYAADLAEIPNLV